jgi:formiminotetrahydrofolate cyclodeaminase
MAEVRKKAQAISAAAVLCAEVPQTIAATAVSVLDICEKLADGVNPNLLSDLAVCAELAMAASRAALFNVRANLAQIADPEQRGQIESTASRLEAHATELVRRIIPRINDRMSRGG